MAERFAEIRLESLPVDKLTVVASRGEKVKDGGIKVHILLAMR